jgi:hypothetical protein
MFTWKVIHGNDVDNRSVTLKIHIRTLVSAAPPACTALSRSRTPVCVISHQNVPGQAHVKESGGL